MRAGEPAETTSEEARRRDRGKGGMNYHRPARASEARSDRPTDLAAFTQAKRATGLTATAGHRPVGG